MDTCIIRNVFALKGGRSDHDGIANGEALLGGMNTQPVNKCESSDQNSTNNNFVFTRVEKKSSYQTICR